MPASRTNVPVRRTRPQPVVSPLACDVAGIVIVAIGVISLVSLASPADSGEIGRDIARLLRLLAGGGAYVFPLLAFLVAVLLLFGALRVQLTRRTFSAVGLWLAAVAWLHVLHAQMPLRIDQHFSETAMQQGGGYIGAGISYFLLVAFGRACTLVVLGAAGIVALMLMLDIPFFSLTASFVRRAREQTLSARRPAVPAPATGGRSSARSAGGALPGEPPAPEPEPEPEVDHSAMIARAIEERRKAMEEAKAAPAQKPAVAAPAAATEADGLGITPADPDQEFVLPPLDILDPAPPMPERSADELSQNVEIIERTLQEFRIKANVVEIAHGPTVTRYEVHLAPGIRVSKIVSLADNIAMSLAAINVRVEAPIPGKSAIGVEVPNRNRGLVTVRDILQSQELLEHPSRLAFALGLDVAGHAQVADLCQMPHLLVAGATNMGKSVMLNSLISSILCRARPDEVRFVLIDPKRVELSLFDGIPHLICPVIREVRAAAGIFRAAVQEMERRYDKLANAGTRNIQNYNKAVGPLDRLPYIVIVVDELADLMMQAAAEVEGSICRIAQLARAVGIHLVIATQRPSVDVVTGTIKANIASRIAFAVSSQVDSRTVLDQNGAERLIGKGDMLFRPIDAPKPLRIQGAFISEQEVKRLVTHLREQRKPEYTLVPVEAAGGGNGVDEESAYATADEFYEPAVRLVVSTGRASTSMIQRRFRIGYTRAARLVDAMEQQGIVGPPDGANPREVLITADTMDDILGLPTGTTAAEQELDEEDNA